jgi:hypothetical protein
MRETKRPQGAANTEGPKPKGKRTSPSLLDLETLWQDIAWRLVRRGVATLFLAGGRGLF